MQTSKSECWNPCEANVAGKHCDVNADCLLIPETSDFKCECRPGFNGTGKVCKDVCDGYCENKGTCVKDLRGQPSCRCVGSFIGPHCEDKSDFAYIAGGIAATVVFLIVIALFVWMICARSERVKEPKKLMAQTNDQTGSQVNFYYGAAPYAESIAPSHHSTYAHYYDDEEDGWEMPNFYNETYMKGKDFQRKKISKISSFLFYLIRCLQYLITLNCSSVCIVYLSQNLDG